jgi:ankyrin repeat protein
MDKLLLLEDKDGCSPALLSVKEKSIEVTRLLLESGVDVEHCNGEGKTNLLHMASQSGSLEIVKLLLEVLD